MRLRRSDLDRAGHGRRRRGRGFSYVDRAGRLLGPVDVGRIRELVIPPAWTDVWICPHPNGHIQATGVDAAGRKQYLYHPQWRAKRDEAKFDHVLEVARHLPELRKRVAADLAERGLCRSRVLATITRLLDMGMFRVGSDEYAVGEEPTFGLATLRPEHARRQSGCVVLEFPSKGGVEQVRRIAAPEVCAVLADLRRRRRGADRLFAYWVGRQWRDVRADDVNGYLRENAGTEMTAKDFRTWHATVLAARRLAAAGPKSAESARRRAVAGVMREVSELLGNTPTVARASYVDPRVVQRYAGGRVLRIAADTPVEGVEAAVLELLTA
ncbi:DNA topoisomerase IB [Plantactinospora sp. KBS50]|uniref:DNA topoisomerase IB n=1 Tax=Plantactinospora sp. KBS50 TaxID=2024580 RepID=UPI000BAAD0D6|nr:DNA topoisomerase IB [Plantactinospora sp. KBS50]ASW58064.1 DNA topoisomerase [Plantactinospora sp. KBS50]